MEEGGVCGDGWVFESRLRGTRAVHEPGEFVASFSKELELFHREGSHACRSIRFAFCSVFSHGADDFLLINAVESLSILYLYGKLYLDLFCL